MFSPAITTSVVNAVPDDRRATATGLLQMMGQVGAVAGITVSGAIVAAGHGPARFSTSFLVALIPAVFSLVAAGFILSGHAPRPAAAGPVAPALEQAAPLEQAGD
jgi:MFS family permease